MSIWSGAGNASWAKAILSLNPRVFYFSDDGLGQMTTLAWMKQVGERQLFQIRTAERTSESREGVEFEQSFRFAWFRSGRGRGWVVQASVFPQIDQLGLGLGEFAAERHLARCAVSEVDLLHGYAAGGISKGRWISGAFFAPGRAGNPVWRQDRGSLM
jgi:hypothetical protein